MTKVERKGILFVLATAVISGFSIFINKFGVKGFDPYLFAWMKNTVVAIFLLALVLGVGEFGELKKLRLKDWLLLTAIGLIGGSVPFLLFFKGLSMTTGANAAFIHKTMFVYVGLLAAVFLKERIGRRVFLASCFLLLGNALFLKILPFGSRPGDLLIFVATLLWAGENVLSKHVLKGISPRIVALGRMGIGSIFILLFLIATGNLGAIVGLTPAHFGWVFVTAALLFGYVATWYTGLRDVRASVATSILLLGSPITTLLTLLIGNTALLPPIQILGMLLLVLGVAIVIRPHELARA